MSKAIETLYEHGTVNEKRVDTDRLFTDTGAECAFTGILDKTIRFVEDFQLLDSDNWARFVNQFKVRTDSENNGWRGEYWGKMMRGAAFTYAYTRDEKLYKALCDTVEDMLTAEDEFGRISSFTVPTEFHGWDLWCRKYVMLGMQYFMEICEDEDLKKRCVASMCRQCDYLISKLGPKREGKLPITSASECWRGLNSSSILEPVVRLYDLTGDKKYLDFASYIVSEGGTSICNIFDLAYEDKTDPYQYPVTKAYEMMSCFEGLAEYYRVTGEEKYRRALINFGRRVLETEVSVIGCCGCTHELFDHTSLTQTDDDFVGIMQETCVSVTLMKLASQLLRLTADPAYADVIEQSFFNAYLGSLNTHRVMSVVKGNDKYPELRGFLPFDSYSPLRYGTRGQKIGGLMRFYDENGEGHFYGCCACIGAAGAGIIPRIAAMRSQDGICLSFWLPGTVRCLTPAGNLMKFEIEGNYPIGGDVTVTVHAGAPERMTLSLRIPQWSRHTRVRVNGECIPAAPGYLDIRRVWRNGDRISLQLDESVYAVLPPDEKARGKYIALRRGCIVLAAYKRDIGDTPLVVRVDEEGRVIGASPSSSTNAPDAMFGMFLHNAGRHIYFIDYASAGKTYDEQHPFAAWVPGKIEN